jgi:hypothetical protein
VALIGITLHHTFGPPETVIRIPHVFYFDFAGIFVLVSGCVGGLAFGKAFEQGGIRAVTARCFKRAGQLWAANMLTLVLTLLAFALATRAMGPIQHEALRYFAQPLTWRWVGEWFIPHQGADFFDVLVLYMLLLLMTPAFIWLMSRRWWLGMLTSCVIYIAAWSAEHYSLIPHHHWAYAGAFNVLGWQAGFVLGLTIGWAMKRKLKLLPESFGWWWATLGTLIALCWCKAHEMFPPNWYSKWDARPLFWIHLLLLGALIWRALPPSHGLWHAGPARALAIMGHRPLPIFCITMWYALVAGAMIELLSLSRWQSYAMQVMCLTIVWLIALALYRYARKHPQAKVQTLIGPVPPETSSVAAESAS